MAKYILEIVKYDAKKMAAINLKFSEKSLEILEHRGMTVSFYDRRKEPKKIKMIEGMTIPWGVKEALRRVRKPPDAIYHRGDVGKEPMIVVFGEQAFNLAKLATELAKELET